MPEEIFTFIRKNKIFLLLFLAISFLRLTLVPKLFVFGIDEEYQSFLGWSIVKDFHLIWIGLSAADTGFYVGPGLVYLHSLLLFLSSGDPIILAYSAVIIGLLTTLTIYLVTKSIFNKKTATIAMLLYGFSSFLNIYDRKFWNPTLAPLVSLFMFYSIYKAFKNDRWWIIVAFLLATIFHIHASLFAFFVLTPIIFVFYLIYAKKRLRISTILFSIVTFFVIYSPLIVYDLAKNFDNLKTPLRLLKRTREGGGGIHFGLLSSTISQTFFSHANMISNIILLILLIGSIFVIFKNKKDYRYILLTSITSGYLFLLLLFPGRILDYYLLGCIPLIIILSSLVLSRIPTAILSTLTIVYISINIYAFIQIPIKGGLEDKKEFIQTVTSYLGNKSFYLDTGSAYLYDGGWRYLFKMYGATPAQSRADNMFGWIYPDEISQSKPEYLVVVNKGNETNISDQKALKIIKNHNFSAHVYKNE